MGRGEQHHTVIVLYISAPFSRTQTYPSSPLPCSPSPLPTSSVSLCSCRAPPTFHRRSIATTGDQGHPQKPPSCLVFSVVLCSDSFAADAGRLNPPSSTSCRPPGYLRTPRPLPPSQAGVLLLSRRCLGCPVLLCFLPCCALRRGLC